MSLYSYNKAKARAENFICSVLRRMNKNIDYLIIGSGTSSSLVDYCYSYAIPLTVGLTIAFPLLIYMVVRRLDVAGPLYFYLFDGAVSGLALGLALSVGLPAFRYSSRGDSLEAKFHVFTSTLAALLAGGSNITDALRGLSTYKDELREFNVEIRYIELKTSLGEDPSSILSELSRITPSQGLRALFESLAKGVSTGSDPVSIVRYHLEVYTNYYYSLVDKVSASIGSLLEMYLSIGMIVPILVTIMGLLFSVYPVKGLSFGSLIILVVFILIPVLSFMTIILVDDQISKIRL